MLVHPDVSGEFHVRVQTVDGRSSFSADSNMFCDIAPGQEKPEHQFSMCVKLKCVTDEGSHVDIAALFRLFVTSDLTLLHPSMRPKMHCQGKHYSLASVPLIFVEKEKALERITAANTNFCLHENRRHVLCAVV